MDGDVLGFLSESDNSGIVYDFRPLGFGARVRTKVFSSLPRLNHAYNFDAIAYDTWVFAVSALIDTSMTNILYSINHIPFNNCFNLCIDYGTGPVIDGKTTAVPTSNPSK